MEKNYNPFGKKSEKPIALLSIVIILTASIILTFSIQTTQAATEIISDWTDVVLPYQFTQSGNYRVIGVNEMDASHTNSSAIYIATGVSNVYIDGQNILIDGLSRTDIDAAVIGAAAYSAYNITLVNVYALRFHIGLQSNGAWNVAIDNCTFSNNDGVNAWGCDITGAKDWVITNSKFSNNTLWGIGGANNNSSRIYYENCTFNYNGEDGLTLSDDSTAINCIAIGNGDHGIGYFGNATVTNCTSYNNLLGISAEGVEGNATVTGNTVYNNTYGVHNGRFGRAQNNSIFTDNLIYNNTYGMKTENSENVVIYNNFFNNTNNFAVGGTNIEFEFNTTQQTGTRIYSDGTEIGGNFWATPTGTGVSETGTDANYDGFVDDAYLVFTSTYDYLPLSSAYGTEPTTIDNFPITTRSQLILTVETAGTTLISGQVVYLNSDGKYYPADASAEATIAYGNVYLNIINATTNEKCLLLIQAGDVLCSDWSLTIGQPVYVSEISGQLTQTKPVTSESCICVVGVALSATSIRWNPTGTYVVNE